MNLKEEKSFDNIHNSLKRTYILKFIDKINDKIIDEKLERFSSLQLEKNMLFLYTYLIEEKNKKNIKKQKIKMIKKTFVMS